MKFETLKAIEDPKQRISVVQAMLVQNVVYKSNTMLCYGFFFIFLSSGPGGGGGGDSHMKQTGMLVVSFRGVDFGFWSRLGCSRQSANILSRQGLV